MISLVEFREEVRRMRDADALVEKTQTVEARDRAADLATRVQRLLTIIRGDQPTDLRNDLLVAVTALLTARKALAGLGDTVAPARRQTVRGTVAACEARVDLLLAATTTAQRSLFGEAAPPRRPFRR